jgi:hypothetical protein
MSNAIGTNIRSDPDQNQAGKDVTITLPKAVAKANNRSTITAAQKGGRVPKRPKPTPESALEPAPEPVPKTAQKAPKSAQKAQKPAPKASIKRKRAEVEDGSGEGEEPSPHRLRSWQY